jgi:hypothetical protein
MARSRGKIFLALVVAVGLGSFVGAPSAHAQNGSWSWGSCGSTSSMSAVDRENMLVNSGIADPCVNYWTPFYGRYDGPNYWVGTENTGYQNTFAVNHDINANFGIPYLGYIDVLTPLMGTNELAIASAVSTIWNNLVGFVSNVWNSITSLFSTDYSSYSDTSSYSSDGYYDDSFVGGFSDYGYYYDSFGGGGGCLVAGTPVTMADGSTKPIEAIKKGDRVLAYDPKTQALVAAPVETAIVHKNWKDRSDTVLINGQIRATLNHRFLVNGRWVRADQINVGDTLVTATPSSGSVQLAANSGLPGQMTQPVAGAGRTHGVQSVKVTSVKHQSGVDRVYAIIVDKYFTYFVNGILVHSFV